MLSKFHGTWDILDFIVGDCLPVVVGQQVFPVVVPVGVAVFSRLRAQLAGRVGVGLNRGDVAAGVVGIHGADVGFLVVRADKLKSFYDMRHSNHYLKLRSCAKTYFLI